MKKLILSAFAFCFYSGAFAQVLPPVNVWTPGGGNIFFNGGNVGIGLNSPLYPLHVAGSAFVSKGIYAGSILTGSLKTDTVQTGVINVPTGTNNLNVAGGARFAGELFSNSLTVFGLAHSNGLAELFVDTTGNLVIPRPINPSSYPSCTNTNPAWRIGGNAVGARTGANIGTCDNYNFILKAGNVEHVWLTPDGKLGVGNSNPAYQFDVTGSARITGTLSANTLQVDQSITAPKFITSRITYPDTNGIHFGDSSMVINVTPTPVVNPITGGSPVNYDMVYSNQFRMSVGYKQYALGNNSIAIGTNTGTPSKAYGNNSMAIGTGNAEADASASMAIGNNIKAHANVSMVIGKGSTVAFPLVNNTPTSLMIGYGSNYSSIFVNTGSTNNAGYVGIGYAPANPSNFSNNPNPYKMLTVYGDISLANYNSSGGNSTDGFNGIEILGGNKVPTKRGISTEDNSIGDMNFYVSGNTVATEFNFKNGFNQSSPINLMTLNATGQLLLGHASGNANLPTSNSTHSAALLQVNGDVVLGTNNNGANIWVRASNWADFVFDKNYKLMPLSELENFYKANHHLPNVPTQKEIQENGNNLGQTDVTLLQKIEELTLYMVAQQKEIEVQKKLIEELYKKVEEKK